MRPSTTFTLAIASAACLVSASPAPVAEYGVEEFSWSIEVAPGQVEVLKGTIEEVYGQAAQINPNFRAPSNGPTTSQLKDRSLSKRNVICGNFPAADKGRIQQGINYLNNLPAGGRPTNGPGPGNCGRVSCSYNAAIWWCNDNTSSKTLDGWEYIARSAQHLVNTCASGSNAVSGQNFESGNWNTIVRGDNC